MAVFKELKSCHTHSVKFQPSFIHKEARVFHYASFQSIMRVTLVLVVLERGEYDKSGSGELYVQRAGVTRQRLSHRCKTRRRRVTPCSRGCN